MKSVVCSVALASLTLASPALADPRAHHHNSGFMFRGTLGFGFESLALAVGSTDSSLSGPGGALSVALGGFVTRNLAINADLYGAAVVDPTVKRDGNDLGEVEATVGLASIGLGLTYYFMPLNLYVAGSVGAGKATIEIDNVAFESELGLSVHVSVGKEWFVSRNWGLGIAVEFLFADVPTETSNSEANYLGFNLAFSATYN